MLLYRSSIPSDLQRPNVRRCFRVNLVCPAKVSLDSGEPCLRHVLQGYCCSTSSHFFEALKYITSQNLLLLVRITHQKFTRELVYTWQAPVQ
ncbi:hypothetical protein Plhal304r1_c098g0174371 [Plasmopara halstedii]